MKRVAVRMAYPPSLAHPIHGRLRESEAATRMVLLQWGPTAAVRTLSWFDAGPEAVETALAGVDAVTDASLVADDGGTQAFVRQSDFELAEAVLDLVAAAAVVFLPPVTFDDTGEVTVAAVGSPGSVSDFHERLSDLVDARIERVDEFRGGSGRADVTPRQQEALEVALDAGYYEVPRRASVSDVAAALGCATSTAGELLRRAEAGVVGAHVQRRGVPGPTQ